MMTCGNSFQTRNMIQTIKRYFIPALLISLAVLCFIVFFTGRDDARLKTFKTESGWGYVISTQDKMVIRQPFIPAIEGKKPFETRGDARRAGQIIKHKIEAREDPTVNVEELLKAGVRI